MGRITTVWENRKLIMEGIKNSILKDDIVEEIAQARMAICNECPSKGKKCLVKGTAPCCNECGCSLAFKTRSLSSECPSAKWKAVLSEEEEDEFNNINN